MLVITTDEKSKKYVCESCGAVHSTEDEIFHLLGFEMCTKCANVTSIEDRMPDCDRDCSRCYVSCPLFER